MFVSEKKKESEYLQANFRSQELSEFSIIFYMSSGLQEERQSLAVTFL